MVAAASLSLSRSYLVKSVRVVYEQLFCSVCMYSGCMCARDCNTYTPSQVKQVITHTSEKHLAPLFPFKVVKGYSGCRRSCRCCDPHADGNSCTGNIWLLHHLFQLLVNACCYCMVILDGEKDYYYPNEKQFILKKGKIKKSKKSN